MGAKKYTGEIKSYNFSSFSDHTAASETYNFQSFELQDVDQSIIAKEHGDAKSSGFAIGAEIKKQRGHAQYELDQYNIKIQQEVDKKVELIKSQVTRKSYEHAIRMAKTEIEDQFAKNFDQQVADLTNFVNFIKEQQREIIAGSKRDVLKIVQLVVQWVLQREVKLDYIDNLLPLILNQVQENQKILIKVDPKTYDYLQNADNLLTTKFSSFTDIKVILDEHISHPGVIVETNSNVFDATQAAQQELINNIFSNLVESQNGSNSSES